MTRYWGMSLGEGSKYTEHAKQGGYIAIGWNLLSDVSELNQPGGDRDSTRATFMSQYKKVYPGSQMKVSIGARQVWNFVVEMAQGDVVLVRDPVKRLVHLAKVTGEYVYNQSPGDGCPYKHLRTVTWLKQVSRDAMSQKLKDSMGSLSTIFSVNKHAAEIESLLTGILVEKTQQSVTGPKLREEIIRRLLDMNPKDFEEFTASLLSTLGFETATTKYVGDEGIDIEGTLNAEGVATIDLRVQVKRYRHAAIGIGAILTTRGALGADEHGAFVTTTTFTKQARQEAQAPGKKPIALVDSSDLVDLILNHFDELDSKYQTFLGLRRKETALEERFVLLKQGW